MQDVEKNKRLPCPILPIFDILPDPTDVHWVLRPDVVHINIEPIHQKAGDSLWVFTPLPVPVPETFFQAFSPSILCATCTNIARAKKDPVEGVRGSSLKVERRVYVPFKIIWNVFKNTPQARVFQTFPHLGVIADVMQKSSHETRALVRVGGW